MMKPNPKLVTISNNEEKIKELLFELVLIPRINALKWSKITRQTPNIKIGYPGQHLASLITGMVGEGTGARGNDLIDGSEVKSCSRIDQLDQCKDCKQPVTRFENQCPQCKSTDIVRKNDSKWLFSVRNENELTMLLETVDRVLLLIGDYPNFDDADYETLRFQAFEIWTKSERNKRFSEIIRNYYSRIYLAHKKRNPSSNPAPKNFWPYSYQFYLCNPISVFACKVNNANTKPNIVIEHYIKPDQDRSLLPSPIMPLTVTYDDELKVAISKASSEDIKDVLKSEHKHISKDQLTKVEVDELRKMLIGLNEKLRGNLPLRDTDKISTAKETYSRRNNL